MGDARSPPAVKAEKKSRQSSQEPSKPNKYQRKFQEDMHRILKQNKRERKAEGKVPAVSNRILTGLVQFSVQMPDTMADRLDELAEKEGRTRSSLVRRMLREHPAYKGESK